MKTKAFKCVGWIVMALFMVNLSACGLEIEYDDRGDEDEYTRAELLCSRTWVSHYKDTDGNRCRQELDFYLDGVGVDYVRVDYSGGRYVDFEYKFKWRWDNIWQTSIRMNYGDKDISYLDDVFIGGNRLSGYLDGKNNYVEYKGKK